MEGRADHDTPTILSSSDNPTIKLVRSLRQRKTREAERLFLVEGQLLIEDLFAVGVRPELVLIRENEAQRAIELSKLAKEPFDFKLVDRKLFDSLSDAVTPQGILAIVRFPELSMQESERPLVLVVDSMSDPGNLGTLLRVAAGAGVTAVFLTKGTVDPYNPKAVRAGMGAHFRIPIQWIEDGSRSWIVSTFPTRILADAGGELMYDKVDWTGPVALLIGPETGGFSKEIIDLATSRVKIPLQNALESLNAAVAAAVMLFEASRQRRADDAK